MQGKKRLFLGANWKMNPVPAGALDPASPYRSTERVEVVVLPTFLDLQPCIDAGLTVGAQCGRAEEKGAFTGDVSMRMLKDRGCTHVLCGHSERRKHHGDTDAEVAAHAQAALDLGLVPIVCIGETDEERQRGDAKSVVTIQLTSIPRGVAIIAYEPVWAIGTGRTPTPEDVQEMHAFLRAQREDANVCLLYGGSLSQDNAEAILALPDVDGGLVGGASLRPSEFAAIVQVAAQT